MRLLFFISVYLFFFCESHAQVAKSVVLDSVVVEAVKRGFDVDDFIEMVKADTSFLKAFRFLRNSEHEVIGTMTIFGRKDKISAARERKALQVTHDRKRWIDIKKETVTGNFYNRKDHPRTYTATLFDDIFFYTDTLPVQSTDVSISSITGTHDSGNISKLKKLVFNPGAEIEGVPVIGKRMAIFDDHMVNYYDYKISVAAFRDSVSCYVFSCSEKPNAGDYPVLRNLITWFDRKTFNIVYREYQLKYTGLLFDFDVIMKVSTGYHKDKLYPSSIFYSGYWDLPLKRAEKVDFLLEFKMTE